MLITKFLHNCMNSALKELILEQNITFDSLPEFIIEKPKNKDHGDYASSLPLQLSKILKDSPINIANRLINKIESDHRIDEITVANPGFINFKMSKEWIQKEILNCISLNKKFGNSENNKKDIQVEFVSVNPTGKLHLGHIRGAVIGSTLSNVLATQNYSITKEYESQLIQTIQSQKSTGSVAHMVGNCTYEPTEKNVPKKSWTLFCSRFPNPDLSILF